MKPTLDWSEAPLLFATFYPTITTTEVGDHFRELERASFALGRLALVVDLTEAPLYSPSLARLAGEEMKTCHERVGDRIVAVAHLVPSALARALLASVQWLAPPPFPSLVTASRDEARSWVMGHLERAPAGTLLDVRDAIGRTLPDTTPTLTSIGRSLGMSRRTLQRRLSERGVTFGQILDSARRDAAMSAITRPGASVHEVALSCGYDDVKALRRAFRRWTGRSPSEYRKQQI
jgi:AraC-like DNA-binding protein